MEKKVNEFKDGKDFIWVENFITSTEIFHRKMKKKFMVFVEEYAWNEG